MVCTLPEDRVMKCCEMLHAKGNAQEGDFLTATSHLNPCSAVCLVSVGKGQVTDMADAAGPCLLGLLFGQLLAFIAC